MPYKFAGFVVGFVFMHGYLDLFHIFKYVHCVKYEIKFVCVSNYHSLAFIYEMLIQCSFNGR